VNVQTAENAPRDPVDPLDLGVDDATAPSHVSHRFRKTFLRNRLAVAGSVFLLLLLIIVVFAKQVAPKDPNAQDLISSLAHPGKKFWLGTDLFGRDVLSRLIFGARTSMLAGLEAVAIAASIGTLLGLWAGNMPGIVDSVLTFISNMILSVPGLVFAIAVIASLGPGLVQAMFAVGIIFMPRFFRLVRGTTRSLKSEPFVRASISVGCTNSRVLFAHILPNALPPLLVDISLVLGTSILAEASLSFLGLGVQPPTASWGAMLADAASRPDQLHLLWAPGIALVLTLLSFAFVADGLRDALGSRRRS
jgi:ABC-type dipeptide/oligopeptide/nickel transport system permease subunit